MSLQRVHRLLISCLLHLARSIAAFRPPPRTIDAIDACMTHYIHQGERRAHTGCNQVPHLPLHGEEQ